ncbi:hypothetical protein [Bradyrhizobium sp. CB3481]|uniref:hypothetical protein n=1 Tax=Bradyrhizobium sp. CB3481 TaxID=3039158 RepID=UPI0024B0F83E|nr:hypothetical protein [Bradyrhizobium sp. CB3481]WFU14037.1 hypothetical protein QA643_22715 [Bradyrhizobium sp. CB3481]
MRANQIDWTQRVSAGIEPKLEMFAKRRLKWAKPLDLQFDGMPAERAAPFVAIEAFCLPTGQPEPAPQFLMSLVNWLTIAVMLWRYVPAWQGEYGDGTESPICQVDSSDPQGKSAKKVLRVAEAQGAGAAC